MGEGPRVAALPMRPRGLEPPRAKRSQGPQSQPWGCQMRPQAAKSAVLHARSDASDASGGAFVLTLFSRRRRLAASDGGPRCCNHAGGTTPTRWVALLLSFQGNTAAPPGAGWGVGARAWRRRAALRASEQPPLRRVRAAHPAGGARREATHAGPLRAGQAAQDQARPPAQRPPPTRTARRRTSSRPGAARPRPAPHAGSRANENAPAAHHRERHHAHHHPRVIRRATLPVRPIGAIETGQIHPLDSPSTVHTRWSSGTQSANDGGINNTCPRSHVRKFWLIPGSS